MASEVFIVLLFPPRTWILSIWSIRLIPFLFFTNPPPLSIYFLHFTRFHYHTILQYSNLTQFILLVNFLPLFATIPYNTMTYDVSTYFLALIFNRSGSPQTSPYEPQILYLGSLSPEPILSLYFEYVVNDPRWWGRKKFNKLPLAAGEKNLHIYIRNI